MRSDPAQLLSREDTKAIRAMIQRLHKNTDTDAIVDELLEGYASSRALADMSVHQLSQKLPMRTAELVHLIPGLARALLRNNYPAHPVIGCLDDACKFLYGHFLGHRYEQCYLLLLRRNRYLIRDLLIQSGTVDSLPFYTRNILEVIINSDADAIVLAHNHPGGTASPSDPDIACTKSLIEALRPLDVPLLDHLIFAKSKTISIRESKYIDQSIWLSQPNHCPKLLTTWLDSPKKPEKKYAKPKKGS